MDDLTTAIAAAVAPLRDQIDRLIDRVETLHPGGPRLVSIGEAAELLSLSSKTVGRLLDTRQLPYVQTAPGAAKRIRVADLEAWTKANTVRAIR